MAGYNKQDSELFLNNTNNHAATTGGPGSTPAPLRINKTGSPLSQTGSVTSDEPRQQWAAYNVPQSSAHMMYGAPTSPPPMGPLPYPDVAARRRETPTSSAAGSGFRKPPSRTGTPQDREERASDAIERRRRQSMTSDASTGSRPGHKQRPHFNANDPNRPSISGYGGQSPPGSSISDRRGTPAKSLFPESPGGPEPPEKDDEEGLFQLRPQAKAPADPAAAQAIYQQQQQQYYPPPLGATPTAPASTPQHSSQLYIPNPAGVNRLDSTASTSTTRASRGSPPPPETPIDPAGSSLGGIEARFAASGIPGSGTLNAMQAQSAAARARQAQYTSPQPQRATPAPLQTQAPPTQPFAPLQQMPQSGRWSPTERPGTAPHGPPISFQGNEEVDSPGGGPAGHPGHPGQESQLEPDMSRLNVLDEPPPAYSPPVAGSAASQYPNEKGRYADSASPVGSAAGKSTVSDPNVRAHPAFANDNNQAQSSAAAAAAAAAAGPSQQNGSSTGMTPINIQKANHSVSPAPSGAGPASPPPLPEGWIAHLDGGSGQYYYIHLPTQSTQWEFPKGPTPLSLQEPMSPISGHNPLASPVGSIFKQPLQSPGFGPVPQSATFRHDSISMNSLASPTAAGFTGPPPTAGVDMYKIAPTNGVYFGPYLRYTNMDIERGLWLGSIMLISDAAQPPTIHLHQSVDLSPNPRQLKAHPIYSHQRWIFYRYDVDIQMEEDHPAKWTYAITSHLGCTRYEFLVAGRYETSWRFIAHSGNDFAINVSANDRSKLGGVSMMWKDVLLKNQECGGFHTQIGLGGQIYADRLWKDIPSLRQWTQTSGKDIRKNAPWSPKLDEDVTHAYFHYYTSHFDQPAVREAFAQIPHVCCLDDHDIFDGYGSYPEHMQQSNVFKNIGRLGIEMYLLFQHHTSHEILRNVNNDIDLFTITGTGWHFVKYLGPSVVLVGPDTRSERTTTQVMAGPTYQGLFPKVAVLPPSVQHCLWLFPVPIVYPRLEAVEQVAQVAHTGKKMVTGGFNMLGRVAGGVAGVVGAKGVVNQGFDGVKRAVGKSGLMQGVLSPFGEVEVLDELRDMWTHESKDLERTYIIRTLQGISHNKSLRMTFLSGGVSSCGAGLVHDPSHPGDHKTMYQLISAPIVNAPSPSYVLRMLHSNKPLYVPGNGHRSLPNAITDTKEDMMEIFGADVDGRPREYRRLMARRNYLACVAYDPEIVQGAFGGMGSGQPGTAGRLSLAADFMVQGDGAFGQPMKYGPVIVPSLEYGR
ncbi:hypothetical protein K431DRAFT_288122 [Polychaeton citri CBS 116435]|uniref:WW domain-containing protein n=1 Tax=Polychaeton citri CBS 116435 TaxID=1314669 RepID=A0A9P4Q1Q1_9PEZI|nr:hypothetical protein K431DRAFT_288122 [Polychaeton citri CBS 116435]